MSDIRNIKTTADNWLAISQDLKWPLTGFTRTLNHMAICSTTCVSWHSQLRPGGFCWSEWTFTVYMLLLVETKAFRLDILPINLSYLYQWTLTREAGPVQITEIYILWSQLSQRKLSPTLATAHYSCANNDTGLVSQCELSGYVKLS